MSEIITVPGRTAQTIAAEIRVIHDQARVSALLAIVEIGKRLVEAKELVDHGEWCNYLQTELGYKQSAANNYMKIYREYEANGLMANSQTFGNLSPSQALALIAIPADEREEFVKENNVEDMSARQLKQVIQERDAAIKAQSEVQEQLDDARRSVEAQTEETRQLRQDLLNLQQQASSAKSSEDAWQAEIDKLNKKLAKAYVDLNKAKDSLAKWKANPEISDSMREQISGEEAAKAAEAVRAELQEQLAAAEAAAQQAAMEREALEKAAQAAQEELAAAQKNTKMSDPDVMSFRVLGMQLDREFNVLFGYRKKVLASHPELEPAMNDFIDKLLEKQKGKLGTDG